MSVENKSLPAIPAKRYFTIGEVSELCGVKAYVLRYWEQEFTQLKPMKRRGNRRYYQHHEVLLIRRIRDLLYEQGFTISGARNQLTDTAAGHAHALSQSHSGAHEAGEQTADEPFDPDAPEDTADVPDAAESDAEHRASLRRNPLTRTRASDTGLADGPHADRLAGGGDDELDEARLDAMARDDLATIARATRDHGDVATATAVHATAMQGASTAATGARPAAQQARRIVGNTPAPAPLDAVYTPAQIRAELLAIRSLLVS
jgi:DNA-binding transcriptional MerR regulator